MWRMLRVRIRALELTRPITKYTPPSLCHYLLSVHHPLLPRTYNILSYTVHPSWRRRANAPFFGAPLPCLAAPEHAIPPVKASAESPRLSSSRPSETCRRLLSWLRRVEHVAGAMLCSPRPANAAESGLAKLTMCSATSVSKAAGEDADDAMWVAAALPIDLA